MAKLSKKKRQRKKQEKRLLRERVRAEQRSLKVTEREIEKASFSSLSNLAREAEKKQATRARKKANREDARRRKAEALRKSGVNPWSLTAKQIDSVKLSDINRQGKIAVSKYPEIFGRDFYDWDRLYKFKEDRALMFGWRDFSGERSLEEVLADFEGASVERLLQLLDRKVHEPATYDKEAYKKSKGAQGGSSGSAGDYLFQCSNKQNLFLRKIDADNESKHPKRKRHGGAYKGFQYLTSNGSTTITASTPRRLLTVITALVYNVTEVDRVPLYKNFLIAIKKCIPSMYKYLPKL